MSPLDDIGGFSGPTVAADCYVPHANFSSTQLGILILDIKPLEESTPAKAVDVGRDGRIGDRPQLGPMPLRDHDRSPFVLADAKVDRLTRMLPLEVGLELAGIGKDQDVLNHYR